MGTVSARATLAGAGIDEAAALWFALERRPTFIDGFADVILIRRRQRASLRRTLARFAIELAAEQELHS